jgi:hypothetical protein
MGLVGLILIFVSTITFIAFYENPQKKFFIGLGLFLLGFGFSSLLLNIIHSYNNLESIYQKKYLENIGVLVATVTAIGALAISIWQGFEARAANRKSVFPQITITKGGSDNKEPGITFRNTGIGPAVIKDVIIYFDNIEIEGQTNIQRFHGFFDSITKNQLQGTNKISIINDRVIQTGDKITIIKINNESTTDYTHRYNDFFSKVVFKVNYCDIYGQKFQVIRNFGDTLLDDEK